MKVFVKATVNLVIVSIVVAEFWLFDLLRDLDAVVTAALGAGPAEFLHVMALAGVWFASIAFLGEDWRNNPNDPVSAWRRFFFVLGAPSWAALVLFGDVLDWVARRLERRGRR